MCTQVYFCDPFIFGDVGHVGLVNISLFSVVSHLKSPSSVWEQSGRELVGKDVYFPARWTQSSTR